MKLSLNTYPNELFLRKTVNDDIRWLTISTCFDPSECVFPVFLLSFWLNVLLFQVSCGGGKSQKSNRKIANVSLTTFQRLEEKFASV
jgi:hypothetical protein